MLTKIVDGVSVVMSAEEEAGIRAEWAATDEAARNAPAPVVLPTIQDIIDVLPQASKDALAAKAASAISGKTIA